MSTETVMINRKIERMRAQYQDNLRSMDEIRTEYEASVNRQLNSLQNDMREKISENNRKTYSEFENEFKLYTEQMNRQLNAKIEDINSSYLDLKKENDEMKEQLFRLENELSKNLHDISFKLDNSQMHRCNEASRRMEKAYDNFSHFSSEYPHEFFEPNAADALLMQMESTKIDFRSGFFEACMADSSNIEFQISMLEDRIKKELEHWIRYFNQYESNIAGLRQLISSEEFCIIKNERFEKELFENSDKQTDTFDFWSSDEYSKIKSSIMESGKLIDSVYECSGTTKEEKIIFFLKKENKRKNELSFELLSDKTDSLALLYKDAYNLMMYIHSGFTASYMRAAVIAPEIIKYLSEERSGHIVKKGFRDNDIRNEYIIMSKETGKNICVTIYPVCPEKINVINSIGIYIEHTGSGTIENLKETEDKLVSSVRTKFQDIITISASNCDTDVVNSGNAMESIKERIIEKRKKELSLKRMVR